MVNPRRTSVVFELCGNRSSRWVDVFCDCADLLFGFVVGSAKVSQALRGDDAAVNSPLSFMEDPDTFLPFVSHVVAAETDPRLGCDDDPQFLCPIESGGGCNAAKPGTPGLAQESVSLGGYSSPISAKPEAAVPFAVTRSAVTQLRDTRDSVEGEIILSIAFRIL